MPAQQENKLKEPEPEIPLFLLEEQQKKGKQSFSILRWLKTFVLPILTLGIFIFILIQFTIPKLTDIFDQLTALELGNADVARLDGEITNLVAMDARGVQIANDLGDLTTSVPTGNAAVVVFQTKVLDLARQFSLEIGAATIGEQILNTSLGDDGPRQNLALLEIPASFSFSGDLSNIQDFVAALLDLDDFVIIGEMRLAENTDAATGAQIWALQVELLKYQFPTPDDENQLETVFSNIPSTAIPSEDVLELVRRPDDSTSSDAITEDLENENQ